VETDDPALLDRWRERWSDLVEFDVLPVVASDEAAALVGARFPLRWRAEQ
jgi:hypothetical protein